MGCQDHPAPLHTMEGTLHRFRSELSLKQLFSRDASFCWTCVGRCRPTPTPPSVGSGPNPAEYWRSVAACSGRSTTGGVATSSGWGSTRRRGIGCGRRWRPVLFSKTENAHILEGRASVNGKLRLILKVLGFCSVSHPFLGDYVRLRQNIQWKKMCLESNDQYVVFADIINKITRSSGKVSWEFHFFYHNSIIKLHRC